MHHHIRNICKGTLFADDVIVFRVTESKARARLNGRVEDVVHYCVHADHLQADPPLNVCEVSSFTEVKE